MRVREVRNFRGTPVGWVGDRCLFSWELAIVTSQTLVFYSPVTRLSSSAFLCVESRDRDH